MTEVVDRGATIAELRRRIAAVNPRGTREAIEPATAAPHTTPATAHHPSGAPAPAPTRPCLLLPEHLQPAFPPAGLPRGSTVELLGARGPAISMVAAVTRAGGSVAIIDTPAFGLLAAHEQGAELARIAFIPEAGADPIAIVSVLTEGIDLIVWTPGRSTFTPSVERGLAARLRTKHSTLLALGPGLRRPDYRLEAATTGFHGINDGLGYLSGTDTTICSSGRNLAPTQTRIRIERTRHGLEGSVVPTETTTLLEHRRRTGS